jgi:predicted alpha/beta hydrolase family esterase
MAKQVLLIHGGGGGAYEADAKLAEALRRQLGPGYDVRYPSMPNEAEPDYQTWKSIIQREIVDMGAGAILVGHSIGASVLIRLLRDQAAKDSIAGVFLIAGPFWHDHEFWHWAEAALPADAADRIPHDLPLYLYHGVDDEFVPVSHAGMYAKAVPQAKVRLLPGRNHQLNEDLTEVARDIERLG